MDGVDARLYYTLAGRPPFVADNPTEVRMAHIALPVPPLGSRAGIAVPADVSGIATSCLEKDPGIASTTRPLAAELDQLALSQHARSNQDLTLSHAVNIVVVASMARSLIWAIATAALEPLKPPPFLVWFLHHARSS